MSAHHSASTDMLAASADLCAPPVPVRALPMQNHGAAMTDLPRLTGKLVVAGGSP